MFQKKKIWLRPVMFVSVTISARKKYGGGEKMLRKNHFIRLTYRS